MAIYPDLKGSGVLFLDFFIHITGGFDSVERFWKAHGWRRELTRLVYATYSRNSVTHTITIEWREVHVSCCDVRLSVESSAPASLRRSRKGKPFRFTVADFRSFFDLIKTMKTPGGIVARYGFLLAESILPQSRGSGLRLTQLTFEEESKRGTKIFIRAAPKGSVLTIEQGRTLSFVPGPTDKSFFAAPLSIARELAVAVGRRPSNG